MPRQSREGDNAHCPSDSHGKLCCSHGVTGPGIKGSPNVKAEGAFVLRIGDPGEHSGCCGPNTWVLEGGSETVFFNGIPASRYGDTTTHCGGTGSMVQGARTVITGG